MARLGRRKPARSYGSHRAASPILPPSNTGSFGIAARSFAASSQVTNITFPQSVLPIKIELLLNGTWTDITSYVYSRDPITITRGRPDETQNMTPSQMTLTLNNRDGRFSPNNPNGAWYPYIARNVQGRASLNSVLSSGSASLYTGYRFWGEVSEWPPQWDLSQTDIYCQITVSGVLRRYTQGATLGAPLDHYYSGLTDDTMPYAWWPCTDGSKATQFTSGLTGGTPMTFTGKPGFASNTAFGGSDPIATVSGSVWHGVTDASADPPGTGTITQKTPGTYYWTCPPGVTTLEARGTGSGGGGGDTDGTTGGSGGGGGEDAEDDSIAVSPGVRYTYVVPAGGAAGAGAGGGSGSAATFAGDAVTLTAHGGGSGGYAGAAAGAGGTGSSNATHHNGGAGAAGHSSSTGYYNDSIYGSSGGSSGGGDGGQNSTNWTAPDNVTGSISYSTEGGGGGGAGAAQSGSSVGGGGGGGGGGQTSGSVSASAGQSYSINAGNGGSGTAANGGHAGTGGESDFDGDASAGGGSGGLEGGTNPAGGSGGSPGGSTGGSGGSLVLIDGSGTSDGGYGGSPNGGSGGEAYASGGSGYMYGGGGGSGGYVQWSWETLGAPTGGGGGGSAGNSSAGNAASGSSGGSSVTGGAAGGNQGTDGSSPGGAGGGAVPAFGGSGALTAGSGGAGQMYLNWDGGVTSPVAADIVRFALDVDPSTEDDAATLMRIVTYGTVAQLDVIYYQANSGSIAMVGSDASSNVLFTTSTFDYPAEGGLDGNPVYVDVELVAVGANVQWQLNVYFLNSTNSYMQSGTQNSANVGYVSDIYVNPTSTMNSSSSTAIGSITVQTYAASVSSLGAPLSGYDGELASVRMARLCAQEGITFTLVGSDSDTPQMGPQVDATFLNLLQYCEEMDRGQIFESRDSLGLSYRTRMNMQRTSPVLSVDYTTKPLAGALLPTADDQLIRNDVTIARQNGASVLAQQTTGMMSIYSPPDGVGDYTYSDTVYAYTDTQLTNLAAWVLSIGTVDEYRYPTIMLDMARTEVTSLFGVAGGMDIGDFIQIYNAPIFLTSDPINQLCWGFSEVLNNFTWTISINAVPQSPYAAVSPPTW